MLGQIFYWIFSMSIAGSVAVCVLLALRKLRCISRTGIRLLWFIPMIRFGMIAGISSEFSFMSILNNLATKPIVRAVPVLDSAIAEHVSSANFVQSAVSYHPVVYKTNAVAGVFSVSGVVWAVGVLALLLVLWLIYFVTLKEVRKNLTVSGEICYSEKVDTPAVYGVFHPKIILPAYRSCMDNRYIILHEKNHIRRMDNLWRMVAFSVAALHWFNPMVWIFLRCFLEDIELACDEAVLSHCSEAEKKEYAMSLLAFTEQKTIFISAFGGASVKLRVKHILNFRKATWLSGALFVMFCTVVICVLLTNPV